MARSQATLSVPDEDVRVLERVFRAQQAARPSRPRNHAGRIADLKALEAALKAHTGNLVQALNEDYGGRSRQESLLTEIIPVLNELRYTRRRLRRWMRPRRVSPGWQLRPASARILFQPLGIIGIVSPWNYPAHLALWPLVSALAAGNQVMVKPSEHTPATAEALRRLLAEVFPAERVSVITGGPETAAAFCALPFDHLLFTGSTAIGRKVMAAAAPNLTPVTLELGGKSPTIVDRDYSLPRAVQRILVGKLINAGQTCVAPDYVLIHEDRLEEFVGLARETAQAFYPEFADNPDYTSIINDREYRRLRGLLDDARDKGARIISLAEEPEPAPTRLLPALVLETTDDMRLMQEEIFGPILPLVPFSELGEAIAYVNARPRPLALYYFGSRRDREQRVLDETLSGGVAINDVVVQVAACALPFGGVGTSGMGQYHGRAGFLTFSKQRAVFHQRPWSPLSLLWPPYGGLAERVLRILKR